jgi:hypothetical protein
MVIQENGKFYHIDDDTGLVSEASSEDFPNGTDVLASEEMDEEFRVGDRVKVGTELGEIITVTPSIYGPAWAVRFDNGDIDEYAEGQLEKSAEDKPDFESPIEEMLTRFEEYQNLPALTNDEVDRKASEARWLNLRARSLVTDRKLAFSDQNDLAHIVLVTGTDLVDINELREKLSENQTYLSRFSRSNEKERRGGNGASLGMTGDASWLDDSLEDMEVVETTDKDLAARATEVVAALTKEQLEDNDSLTLATSFQRDYLQMGDDEATKFTSYLERARDDKLKELKDSEPKVASTEENLDDFDASAIFMR